MRVLFFLLALSTVGVILTWLVPQNKRKLPVLIVTFIALYIYSPISLGILSITTISSYFVLQKIKKLIWAVSINISISFILFFIFKSELIFGIIPLGMSYYLFRQIHYTIEVFKDNVTKHSFWDYVFYLFFLPTIFVGPIHRFNDFQKDMKRRRWNSNMMSEGLERILYGLVKITFFGNFLMAYYLPSFVGMIQEDYSWWSIYLELFIYVANTYFQFAGYSEVAVGLSLMFGFRIIENFKYPFIAKNITDFWQRWHISLSSWCRDYIYFPIVSYSRKAYLGMLASMLVLSMWHAITLNYLIWGIIHGLAINIWHYYNNSKLQKILHQNFPNLVLRIVGIFITLNFVIFSFVLIRKESLSEVFIDIQILLFLK